MRRTEFFDAGSRVIAPLGIVAIVAISAACGVGHGSGSSDASYSVSQVKTSFAENGLALADFVVPEGGGHAKSVLSFPVNSPTPEDIRVMVWILGTSDDGRDFEDYSHDRAAGGPFTPGGYLLGKLEPAEDQVLREGNVVVWYDAGSRPDRLSDVKAALTSLSEGANRERQPTSQNSLSSADFAGVAPTTAIRNFLRGVVAFG